MCGNGNRKPIGKCSQCGGIVSVPEAWMSVNRPVPTCEKCGAVADETQNLPTIKTKPVNQFQTNCEIDWNYKGE